MCKGGVNVNKWFKNNSNKCIFTIMVIVIMFVSFRLVALYKSNIDSAIQSEVDMIGKNLEKRLNADCSLAIKMASDSEILSYVRDYELLGQFQQIETDNKIYNKIKYYWYNNTEIDNIRVFLNGKKNANATNDYILSMEDIKDLDLLQKMSDRKYAMYTYSYKHQKSLNAYDYDNTKMSVIVALTDMSDIVYGYLLVDISKKAILDACVKSDYKNIYVIDKGGNYIISSNENNYGSVIDNIDVISKHKSAFEINSGRDVIYVGGYTKRNWRIVSVLPRSEVYHNKIILYFFMIYLVAVIILYFIYRILRKKHTDGTKKLIDAMKTKRHVEITGDSDKEFSGVYEQYNFLCSDLQKSDNEKSEYYEKFKNSEMNSLMAQINPHFINNVLHSIGYYAIENNQKEICTMISKLAELIKINYDIDGSLSTLKDELNIVNLYLDLEKQCFNKNIDFAFEVPKELENISFPTFILQPLVENSVKHGFSQISYSGIIKIVASKEEDVYVDIIDNGVGISTNIRELLNDNAYITGSYGIRNISQRIKMLYGEKYGIYVYDKFPGAHIRINLPGDNLD